MNKALHVLVYIFAILSGFAFYYAYQIFQDKEELSARNALLRDQISEFTKHIEVYDVKTSKKGADVLGSTTTDKFYEYDTAATDRESKPEMDYVLKNYDETLEKENDSTLNWDTTKLTKDFKDSFIIDPETGKPTKEGASLVTKGSTAFKTLESITQALNAQRKRLNTTRQALTTVRESIEPLVKIINETKATLRQKNQEIFEKDERIDVLSQEKGKLENDIVEKKAQITQLNQDIVGLRDDINNAHSETEAVKEELEKEKEMTAKLKKMVKDLQTNIQNLGASVAQGGAPAGMGVAVSSLPAGDKGRIILVNNKDASAVIEVTPETMKQLKGDDLMRPLPLLEFPVKRVGFKGPAGEIVGRVSLRQEIPGKNWIICDILTKWAQADIDVDDTVYAD